ncbi:hypothetical protein AVU38_gp140 [Ralstonia phage RSL2]|uniref:Uncharacterized protein n=1 Tax=Ralstonia phage RSL2 TaxID=1585840 RepID=A0A0A8J9E1_9CAUD|nr:hypothetical protein AVU38_gp140 [Ralstonia phage RSL2]BAQ02668.1 hypothetical protein [Ralstonia phage RSL2]
MDNKLMKELSDLSNLNPFASEVGGSRKQMFSTDAVEEDRAFEDFLRKRVNNAMGLPKDLVLGEKSIALSSFTRANTAYMQTGLKVIRCIEKKIARGGFSDFRGGMLFLQRQVLAVKLELFNKHLDMWMQSSIPDPQEYWNTVIFNPRFHRTFVERKLGIYTSVDGWQIAQEDIPGEENWVMHNPEGKLVAELPWIYEYEEKYPITLIDYETRFRRHGRTEMDIKYGPAHFPKGTIVEVDPELPDHLGGNRFTVDHIVVMGARNYLLVMKEIKPGVPGSVRIVDEPRQYNMHHVWKIVKRGDGPVDLRDDVGEYEYIDLCLLTQQSHDLICDFIREEEFQMPKLRKGETLFNSTSRLIAAIRQQIGIPADHKAKWIDDSKFHRHMATGGWGRFISVFNPISVRFDSFYAIDVKKLVKFMQKHPDRLFMTLRQVEKLEEEMDRKDCEDLARHFD